MTRHWLLSSTFYGTWLPGDRRGFVGRVRDLRPDDAATASRVKHNVHGTQCDQDMPGLERASVELMKGPPVLIEKTHADILRRQVRETADFRRWRILPVAIMPNHVHLVVEASAEMDETKMLGDFKAYGSRALTARFSKPQSGTWWTYGGSKRLLSDD